MNVLRSPTALISVKPFDWDYLDTVRSRGLKLSRKLTVCGNNFKCDPLKVWWRFLDICLSASILRYTIWAQVDSVHLTGFTFRFCLPPSTPVLVRFLVYCRVGTDSVRWYTKYISPIWSLASVLSIHPTEKTLSVIGFIFWQATLLGVAYRTPSATVECISNRKSLLCLLYRSSSKKLMPLLIAHLLLQGSSFYQVRYYA